jgi:hypothetical protein
MGNAAPVGYNSALGRYNCWMNTMPAASLAKPQCSTLKKSDDWYKSDGQCLRSWQDKETSPKVENIGSSGRQTILTSRLAGPCWSLTSPTHSAVSSPLSPASQGKIWRPENSRSRPAQPHCDNAWNRNYSRVLWKSLTNVLAHIFVTYLSIISRNQLVRHIYILLASSWTSQF